MHKAADIRRRREDLGLSREQLARRAGDVSAASIELYEMGYTPQQSRVLPLILAALEAAEQVANEDRAHPSKARPAKKDSCRVLAA